MTDLFHFPVSHAVTSLFVQISESYDWCLLGLWVSKGHVNWRLVCIFLLKSALVLMIVRSNYGIWHIEIDPGPPWPTCIVVFIFSSVSSLQCLMSIYPITACPKRESDLIKIVEDLSHLDCTLICCHARKGMVLRFPGTPIAWNGLPAWWTLWQRPNCMLTGQHGH